MVIFVKNILSMSGPSLGSERNHREDHIRRTSDGFDGAPLGKKVNAEKTPLNTPSK